MSKKLPGYVFIFVWSAVLGKLGHSAGIPSVWLFGIGAVFGVSFILVQMCMETQANE